MKHLPLHITTNITPIAVDGTPRWAFSVRVDDGETVKEAVHGDCGTKEDALDLVSASIRAMATNRRLRRH